MGNQINLVNDGFSVLPGFLPPERVAALRGEVERLYAAEGEAAATAFCSTLKCPV